MLSADKPQLWLTRSTSSKRHRIGRAVMEANYGVSFAETLKRLNYTWGRLRATTPDEAMPSRPKRPAQKNAALLYRAKNLAASEIL